MSRSAYHWASCQRSRLHPWTGDEEADRLLAADPNALLIGFVLDQQVPVPKAFSGPKVLRERLGHLDPARIAAMPLGDLEAVFKERPAIHRFPGSMAGRVQALCAALATTYDGDGGAGVDGGGGRRRPRQARSARCRASAR